jgi:hypothetical protein
MKIKPILLFVLAGVLMAGASCKDKNIACKTSELVEAPPEFLKYWYFPKGSYWIYKLQDTTGVYDTVRVVKNEITHFEPYDHVMDQVPCSNRYNTYWQHSNEVYFNPYPYEDAMHSFESYYIEPNYWSMSMISRMNLHGFAHMFAVPYEEGKDMNQSSHLENILTLNTTNTPFPNTLHIIPTSKVFDKADSTIGDYPKHIYLSPDVGISRIEYTHNRKWELVDYFIAK